MWDRQAISSSLRQVLINNSSNNNDVDNASLKVVINSNFSRESDTNYSNDFSYIQIFFAVFGVLITLTTIVGNVLVIVAVVKEKKLRKVGNVFIINLAFSDCLVGLIVTSLAVVYELQTKWELGATMCEVWTSMDVICCTSSIVNLCAISYDRYNAIIDGINYSRKRTFQRAWLVVLGVWLYSISIAAPTWFGWTDNSIEPEMDVCEIPHTVWYTVYSTSGAFYIPVVVMVYFYVRIYLATCKRKLEWRIIGGSSQRVSGRPVSSQRSPEMSGGSPIPLPCKCGSACCPTLFHFPTDPDHSAVVRVDQPSQTIGDEVIVDSDLVDQRRISLESELVANYRQRQTSARQPSTVTEASISSAFLSSSTDSSHTTSTSASSDTSSHRLSTSTICSNKRSSFLKYHRPSTGRHSSLQTEVIHEIATHHTRTLSTDTEDGDDLEQTDQSKGIKTKGSTKIKPGTIRRSNSRKRKRITLTQEKRAAKTLGIVMGCFIVCWLPFFLVVTIRTLCPQCVFYTIIYKAVTWLGYFNSTCNPVIYTFFNKDFRNAFKKLYKRRSDSSMFFV